MDERLVEESALELLSELGWETVDAFEEVFGVEGTLGRDSESDPVLTHRLLKAMRVLNPDVPVETLNKAVEELTRSRAAMEPVRANQEIYDLLRDGFPVDVENSDGRVEPVRVRFIDWHTVENNDWLAVSQFWIKGEMYKRRTDVLLFVNGIPLSLMEFKAPHVRVEEAYNGNVRDYRKAVPRLFWFNGFVLVSNGTDTRVGSTYAPWDFFAEWKKVLSENEQGVVSLETTLRATCSPKRFLDLLNHFITYTELPGGMIKALAKNHQYLGVNNAIEAVKHARERDGRLGVFWHTQGSGKSLSMLWFTQKVLRTLPGLWTFVMVTDRIDLDEQLYETFVDSGVITPGMNVQADSSQHLRDLLGADHRYVFTTIQKFLSEETGGEMPVLSDRENVVVITDEAHRSQYGTVAMNMRKALPNASFLGFTGTPLIDGEDELTRQVFGEYVSVYNFRESVQDKATVPLYYENRIPELQLNNKDFDSDLEKLLDEAALDPEQERAVSRQFSRQYHLVTRPERLEKIADDLVEHFINRGFKGKGMYVAIDKATAVKMHDLVKERWGIKLAALESVLQQTPPLERPPLETQIEFMRSTDMAVVVSQAQNEQADMEQFGLDITPHRRRMNKEDLDTKFKDPKDPFRLVFVCAMWLTGFDAPSCSTLYLDKPMRNHTLMQTIARANRVFPDKDNGLIVDYVGVFRSLENALNIYASGGEGGDTPIRDLDELKQNLENALTETEIFLEEINVDLNELELASGFEFIALQDSAADTLLENPETRSEFVTLANQVRDAFKALLPEPAAMKRTRRVQAIRSLAKKIASSSDPPDISDVMDSVSDLLDRSVGAKEYLIRAAHDAHALVDLSTIDFEQLALKFAQNKRLTVNAVTQNIEQRLEKAVRVNPTRADLAEKFRRLLREYNNGTLNVEEILKRLREISRQLTEEENRAVREDLTEEELAIFDLLTKPEPELTNKQREQVKQTARVLLERITERLVVDWRKKAQNRAAMKVDIKRTLHKSLPDAYNKDLFETKLEKIFDHVYQNYRDSEEREPLITIEHDVPLDPVETIADVNETVLARAQADPEYFAELMQIIFGTSDTFSDTTQDLLSSGTEGRLVEYKSTARWNVEEQRKDKTMEHVVAKTVAGFLNAQGGTLLIGVNDDGKPLGLDNDYQLVKHENSDGYISWLDDMLQNALGHAGAHRVQIRIDVIEGKDVCRLDVPASSKPIWLTKGDTQVLFERRNNSTRPVPEEEVDSFIEERFPGLLTISKSL